MADRKLPANLRTIEGGKASTGRVSAPRMAVPRCPQWVSKTPGARAIWRRHARFMAASRTWRPHLEFMLGRLCVLTATDQTDPNKLCAADRAGMLRMETALQLTPEANRK